MKFAPEHFPIGTIVEVQPFSSVSLMLPCHKGRYKFSIWNIERVVSDLAFQYLDRYDNLDIGKLHGKLIFSGILRPDFTDVDCSVTINKSRLKKHIKRLVPHCLITRKKALERENEYNDALYKELDF